jgi:hypothetical protein
LSGPATIPYYGALTNTDKTVTLNDSLPASRTGWENTGWEYGRSKLFVGCKVSPKVFTEVIQRIYSKVGL